MSGQAAEAFFSLTQAQYAAGDFRYILFLFYSGLRVKSYSVDVILIVIVVTK